MRKRVIYVLIMNYQLTHSPTCDGDERILQTLCLDQLSLNRTILNFTKLFSSVREGGSFLPPGGIPLDNSTSVLPWSWGQMTRRWGGRPKSFGLGQRFKGRQRGKEGKRERRTREKKRVCVRKRKRATLNYIEMHELHIEIYIKKVGF